MTVYDREQKKIERWVLLVYFFYCSMLTFMTIYSRWPVWLAVLSSMCWLAGFTSHVAGFRDYPFRAYFISTLVQINVVFWSLSVSDFSLTMPKLAAMAVVLGLYGIPEIFYITIVSATFLAVYHILITHAVNIASSGAAAQVVMELASVYLTALIMFFINKKRMEDTDRQTAVIASLREAERSKDDFMANVSHEIRTPINTICGMSELVLREELDDAVRADIFGIQMAGRNLLSVVSDVLDFSQLQSGAMHLAEEAYNITSTINDIINMSMARKSKKHIDLIVDCSVDIPCSLMGDEQKIRRVIMNLVNNALKFTMEGFVCISISARKADYGINLIIQVRDTGIGLKEESMEKLFTSFDQVDTKRNRQEGGIGLGLAIAQAMVDQMGGFITVQSEFGKGTQMQVVIPQKVLDHRPVASVRDPERLNVAVYIDMEQFERTEIRDEYSMVIGHMIRELKVKSHFCQTMTELKRRVARENYTHIFISIIEYEQDRDYFDQMAQLTKIVAVIDHPDEKKIKNPDIIRLYKPLFILPVVMILNEEKMIHGMDENYSYHGRFTAPDAAVLAVDDNLMNIRVLEGFLRPYKIKVSMATSGAEALEKIESMDFDFVFMDHMMPEMDGIETLHRIRQKPGNYFKKVPIIALTANAIGGMREVFLNEGFQDFLAKPIELSVLERVLRRNLPQDKMVPLQEETNRPVKGKEVPGQETIWLEQAVPAAQTGQTNAKHMEHSLDSGRDQEADQVPRQETDLPLEYFNEQDGLKYCGGIKNYILILQMTYQNGRSDMDRIQKCFDRKDWKNYTIYVHALKSSMVNIGARQMSAMAKELETAGKQGDERFITSHHDALMTAYEQLLAVMQASRTVQIGMRQADTAKTGGGSIHPESKEPADLSCAAHPQNKEPADLCCTAHPESKEPADLCCAAHSESKEPADLCCAAHPERKVSADASNGTRMRKNASAGTLAWTQPETAQMSAAEQETGTENIRVLEVLTETRFDQIAAEFEDAVFAFDETRMTAVAKRLEQCSYHGHSLKEAMGTVMHKIQMSDYMSALEFISGLKNMGQE